MRSARLYASLLLVAVLAACAPVRTYEGPRLPEDEVAVLQAWGTSGTLGSMGYPGEHRFKVRIVTLDGRAWRSSRNIAEVVPGRHVVDLCWTRFEIPCGPGMFHDVTQESAMWIPTHRGQATLTVDAEAGRTYVLRWVEPWEADPPMRFEARQPQPPGIGD